MAAGTKRAQKRKDRESARLEHGLPPFVVHWMRALKVNWTSLAYHPDVEIQLVKRGEGHYLVGDRRYAFRANSLLIVAPNTPHCFQPVPDSAVEKWVLMFDPVLVTEGRGGFRFPRRLPQHQILNEAAADEIETALRLLLAESDRAQRSRRECIAAALRYLLALINETGQHEHSQLPNSPIVT